MSSITQSERTLAVTTPLGADVLLLLGFSGTESLSRLFSYQLELASSNDTISAKEIVGKAVSWSISRLDQAPRYFSGIVSKFVAGAVNNRQLRTYRAEVVPWPWLLTRTTDCRIFQNQNTPEIIESIFKDFGFSDYTLELKGAFPKREYCVQYRETAFNFISRLMEHEGIFFFFRHEDGKHTMVLSNAVSSYTQCPESPVEYSTGSLAPNHIHEWEHHYEFRSGKWTRTDYNFEAPSTNLLTTTTTLIDLPDAPKYEIFDYPGEYVIKGDGDPVTKVRMEEEEAGYNVVSGAGQCCTFTPGGKFTLQAHEVASENGDYVLTSIRHLASELSYGSTAEGASYSNLFTCIPALVIYRPPRATPKPMVQGIQTAVVTGPPGEEIYVDKYGRVKVQFFWDRKGKKNENSSCWIRVSQEVAGKGFGAMVIPRMGQEVIVDFLEGDPDRPLITGRVYNAEQMPPYGLPDQRVVSGTKSKTYKGTGYNEMIFNDTPGKELIRVHGQYDQDSTINHDLREHVGNNRSREVAVDETISIGSNQSSTIGANRTEKVGSNETITIGADRTESVGANEKITIGATKTVSVGASHTETIGASMSISVGSSLSESVAINYSENVGAAMELTVGGLMALSVGAVMTQSVGGAYALSVGGASVESVGSGKSVSVGAALSEKVGAAKSVTVSAAYTLKAASITMTADDKITIKTGGASIVMESGGAITIKGTDITIDGSGKIGAKAGGDIVMKGSNILHN
jgi:type VI secretion system secreted protein VgrG